MTERRPVVIGILLVLVLLIGGAGTVLAGGGRTGGPAPAGEPWALPAFGVGSDVVELSADALADPLAGPVLAQLQDHFGAINRRDYSRWQATVAPERSAALPETAWRDAYRTTRDGTVRVDRIDDLGGGTVLVRVRFVSVQDVADAPPEVPAERICWRGTFPMTGSPPRIADTRGGSSIAAPC